jgi:cation diffusion facilitator CzcD-associated flavoprotein CzcO
VADFDDEDGYRGAAILEAGGLRRDVRVELRGYFQPIDGRYHWYGRIAADPALAEALRGGRVKGTLTTPEGAAPADVGDPDPWGRYRVEGTSTPPFRTIFSTDGDADMDADAAADVDVDVEAAANEGSGARRGAFRLPRPAGDDPERYGPGGLPRHVRVAVVGAGFGGIGAGVKLLDAGIRDFAILERAGSVGGTWRDNTYPGCACDVPSHLYSFSFAPNPRWSRSFSAQPEIRAYLEDVADRPGLRQRLYFDTGVTGAHWQAEQGHWLLHTSRGALTADVVIAAGGPLSEPSVPDLPGLESFPGAVFHSARWDHETELEGKRIAVVGTGASAIQLVPQLQKKAAKLVLFQRTPAWVMPRMDRKITAAEKWLYRYVPPTQRLARLGIYTARETNVIGFVKRPVLLKAASRIARGHLGRAVKDPELRRKLTPGYVMGCKRILLSNDYYPALAKPNAEVIASGLARVEGSTVVAADGSRREVDAIVFATGFHTVDMPMAEFVRGADGRTLAEVWDGDMRALRGTTVAGFPNLCFVIGPNTGLGHNSMVHIIESQLSYIIDYLGTLEASGAAALEADPAALQRWCEEVERRMGPTVWNTGGCKSWYLNAAGRNPTLWPASTVRFRRLTRRVDAREYVRSDAAAHPASAAPLALTTNGADHR